MEQLDLSKDHTKETMSPGSILVPRGNQIKTLSILHSGMAEILYQEEDNGQSLRVGLIKGESPIAIVGILNKEDSSKMAIRTVTECIVSSTPVEVNKLIEKFQSDMPFNFKILRALVSRIESTIYLFNNYRYLWHKFASIADSLALGSQYPEVSDFNVHLRHKSTLEQYAGYVKKMCIETGKNLPENWSYNLFLGKLQDDLKLYDEQDKVRVEELFDYQQFLFIKRLLRKNDSILKALFSNDEPSNRYVFEFLGNSLEKMMKTNMGLATIIENLINVLFGLDGWVLKILGETDNEDPKVKKFLHFLAKFSWRCRKDTDSLLGINLFKKFPVFQELKPFHEMTMEMEVQEEKKSEPVEESGDRLAKYKGLLNKILQFAELPQVEREHFTALMDRFRKSEAKFNSSSEMEDLRRELTEKYWHIYEICFLKIIDSDLKGFVPGIMLHFGLIDEQLVSEKELALIDKCYTGNLYTDDSIPVMTLPYFLEKIYRSEREPSITDMGESFKALIKKQDKMTEGQKKGRYQYQDTAEDRVRFEIRNIARMMGGILFGSKTKAVPFLCSDALQSDMSRSYIDPEALVKMIDSIRDRDFSLFFRDVLFKHELGSDFIKQEVPPCFVLYPLVGVRGLVWQELDGTRKNTPGRFFYPLYFGEKLFDSIMYQLGAYRWELGKTVAGHNWTDPVEGGMVGAYYDYIQFFKKNPTLSPEAKKRLEEFVKKTRSDKDRFTREYMTWVQYEYDGKIRLNGAARDVFYRFCPFPSEVRKKFAAKPLFNTVDNRFNKKRNDEILKLKSRFIKYEKKGKVVPLELQGYMLYLEE